MAAKEPKNILILGGTAEARELARRLTLERGQRVRVITSLAGRLEKVPVLSGEVRVGGFGGIGGLADYLSQESIGLVVDATHPFSSTISDHAGAACTAGEVPRLQLLRPGWKMPPGAKVLEVESLARAAEVLPQFARRVFLTTGVRGLETFSNLDDLWFLVRVIEKPDVPPPLANHLLITGRPPYDFEGERALLAEHDIDALVAKHSGGDATAAKIFAAAAAKVKIVLIRRPLPEPGPSAETVDECMAWIEARL